MKKLLILSLIVAVLVQQSITLFAEEANYDYYFQDFMVSAYYSPVPGQKNYMRGSYEADLKLNGNGTNGADGTEVFPGMIAAPKTYSYGTVIDLPDLGVGAVHDRGGAIVEKSYYHRIDLWMGKGDEGLYRAMNWGMRRVTGKVYFEKNAVDVTMNFANISSAEPISFKNRKPTYTASATSTAPAVPAFIPPVTKDLEPGGIDLEVVELKNILKDLGYFEGETENNYYGVDLEKAFFDTMNEIEQRNK